MAAILDHQQHIVGIYTDGDLRRTLDKGIDIHSSTVTSVMTSHCTAIEADMLAAEAVKIMQEGKINALLVVDKQNKLIGCLNMHDLLQAGVM